ncbi:MULTISPECIES: antitoxin Xre/MbcA/ParS toxin-binding domain-containing protein [unclassified Mesorhizobium]|uniref:antitoxin Xre/MbcA/ParS toxin-binding domain-containing protein n=1 Tax=unclassified Mesorhizobium TaxID=325217 RepID=UPI00301534F4
MAAVSGSQTIAELWILHPAAGLNGRSSIDLVATPFGATLVEPYLERLEDGVYI